MFDHEKYLSKALNESNSIHQLITNLVSLYVNRKAVVGSEKEFETAVKFEKALDKFLEDYYSQL